MQLLLGFIFVFFPALVLAQTVAVDPPSALPAECLDANGAPLCARINHGMTIRIVAQGSCTEIYNPTDKDFFIPMRAGDYLAFLDKSEATELVKQPCVSCPPRCAQPR